MSRRLKYLIAFSVLLLAVNDGDVRSDPELLSGLVLVGIFLGAYWLFRSDDRHSRRQTGV